MCRKTAFKLWEDKQAVIKRRLQLATSCWLGAEGFRRWCGADEITQRRLVKRWELSFCFDSPWASRWGGSHFSWTHTADWTFPELRQTSTLCVINTQHIDHGVHTGLGDAADDPSCPQECSPRAAGHYFPHQTVTPHDMCFARTLLWSSSQYFNKHTDIKQQHNYRMLFKDGLLDPDCTRS